MEANEIATKADLIQVKTEIINALNEMKGGAGLTSKKWLKSAEVMKMLGISASGLQNLRVKGTLPHSKFGGLYYYDGPAILEKIEKSKKGGN